MQLQVQKSLTAAEFAYQHIKEWILCGQLEPGSRINVDELAATLNLSRVPVRGALDKLSSENLVVDFPRRGILVQEVSVENLNSIFSMRCMLEPYAVLQAIDMITDSDIEDIRSLLDSQDHSSVDSNVAMPQNKEFHFALFRLTKDDTLIKVLDNLWAQSNRYCRIYYKKGDYYERIVRDHYALLDAVAARDKQLAVDILAEHTLKNQEMLLELLDPEATLDKPKYKIVAL